MTAALAAQRTYLDTSALVKLVVQERETLALREHLQQIEDENLFTAALARTELVRAVTAAGPEAVARARRVLDRLGIINLTRNLLDDAAEVRPTTLRSLDAIHIAAAQRAGSGLRAIVTYDTRMTSAAQTLGIPVESPA
jgi:uncharacterized protein